MKVYIKATVTSILEEPHYVQVELAEDPSTSSDVLATLSTIGDYEVDLGLAENPNTTEKISHLLLNRYSHHRQECVLFRPRLRKFP